MMRFSRCSHMDGHRRLWTWQQAQKLLQEVYGLTKTLPIEEKYVASSQIRRAAWSVTNNIAEGNAKRGRPEMRRFLDIAIGSLAEIDGMVAGLETLYQLDQVRVKRIYELRSAVNHGIFMLLRKRGR